MSPQSSQVIALTLIEIFNLVLFYPIFKKVFTEEYYARLKEQDEILLTQQNQIEELKQQLYTSHAYLAQQQQQQQQQQQTTSQPSMSQSYGIYL